MKTGIFLKVTRRISLLKVCLLLFAGWCSLTETKAQSVGDYRSRTAVMNWNNAADWERFDGIAWQVATQKPESFNTVFIQNGHTITLTGNEACNDLNLSTGTTSATAGTDATLALQNYTLQISGKIRAYFAPLGTIPGTSTASVSGDPITIIPGSTGKVSFVGNSRIITNAGEWAAVSTAYPTTFAIEINLNPGQTAIIGTVVKATNWSVISGTLDAGNFRLSVDNGSDGVGDFYVAPGAVFKSAKTGSGSSSILSRGATTSGGTMVVDGTLVVSGLSPTIGMKNIQLNGTVEFDRSGSQNFIAGFTDGATPSVYKNIKLLGSGTRTTLPGITTFLSENGTLEITGSAAAATFVLGTGGSLVVNASGSRLIYNGLVAQSTGNEWNPDFSEIMIDNPAGVSLNAAKTISNKLNLNRGVLTTTATRSLTLGENAQLAGGNESSFVNGPLTWVINTTALKEIYFPIGKGTNYKPVALKVTQSAALATNYTAEMFNTAPTTRTLPSDLDKVSTVRYYKLTKGSGGSSISQASLKIFYGPDDAVTDPVNLRMARSSSTSWLNVGGTGEPMVNGSGTITSDINFTTLGDFVLANAKNGTNPLPVKLVYFRAVKNNQSVALTWQTSCETGSDRFEVERSKDNLIFEKIGSVLAAGTTTQIQNYVFEDKNPVTGTGLCFYRLKQLDLDGTITYSRIVAVTGHFEKAPISVYPNPATEWAILQNLSHGKNLAEIMDQTGKVLVSKTFYVIEENDNQKISLLQLQSGSYFVKITNRVGIYYQKLIKQ